VRCGAPYSYAAAYVGHLGDYRCEFCGAVRPRPDVVARAIEANGVGDVSFDLVLPEASRRVRLRLPGLYNVYNALAAATLARELGASVDTIVTGLEETAPAFGRAERIAIGGKTLLLLLIKNPAGANEVVRTLVASSGASLAVIALNDEIADGRDVSWIWDVDFEPLAARLDRLIAAGDRAAELALRFKYAGFDPGAIELHPDLGEALDRGLDLIDEGEELVFLPTYTAMLEVQRVLADRRHAKPYWERVA
jgi:UDP-N-acetylmuramyl tripeptide synthase